MRAVKAVAVVAAALVLVLVGAVLYVDNNTPVALRLLDRESPPLAVFVWLYLAFGCGAAAGFALCFFGFVRGKLEVRRLKRSLRDQEHELNRLRDGQGSVRPAV